MERKEFMQLCLELDRLDLDEIQGYVESVLEDFDTALSSKNYGGALEALFFLSEKIGEVSPQLASIIGALVIDYVTNAKPVFDEIITLGMEVNAYAYESAAKVKKELLPHMEKSFEMDAEVYAAKLRIFKSAGFSRKESMDIILAEAWGSRSSKKSLIDSFKDALKDINAKMEKNKKTSLLD